MISRGDNLGETAEIQHDIDQTRVELGTTIDAIHSRLQPSQLATEAKDAAAGLVDSTKDALRDATIGKAERMVNDMRYRADDTRRSFADTIKENPLPAAVAAGAIGWLFMNRSRGGSESHRYRYSGYAPGAYESWRPGYERGGIAGDARHTAEQVGERAGAVASQVGERAGEMAAEVGERASDVGSGLWDNVSRNPVPVALMALGAAWLWRSNNSSSSSNWNGRRSTEMYGYRAYAPYDRPAYAGYQRPEQESGGVRERVGEVAQGTLERADELTSEAKDRLQAVGSATTERAQAVVETAQTRVQEIGREARSTSRQARGQLDVMLQENPLAVGAIAVGIGAAVGLAIPSTEPEARIMGDARDRLMDRAQETLQQTQEKVQKVAEKAGEAAQSEARAQHVTE
jgi:ElaB/YqjD/DUF883 family membrane-anchored ribosome-binding protein